jgi:hypothetical protein
MHRRTFLLGLFGVTTAAASIIGASADATAAGQPAEAADLPKSDLDAVPADWAQGGGSLGYRGRHPSREPLRRRHRARMRRRAQRARQMRR